MARSSFARAARLGILAFAISLPPLALAAGAGPNAQTAGKKGAKPPAKAKASLYDRLGGKKAIVAVVDDFTARVVKDDRINAKFGKSDDNRLRTLLVEQICEATGGPCKYTGRDMKTSHTSMGVTAGEFDALVEDLVAALDHFKVGKAEKDELLAALAPMKKDIVEIDSPKTGTPLPAEFKPAPPLDKK